MKPSSCPPRIVLTCPPTALTTPSVAETLSLGRATASTSPPTLTSSAWPIGSSPLASAVTGTTIYADKGFHVMGKALGDSKDHL